MNKTWIARALVVTCLAGSALAAPQTMAAEPSLYFYPASKWEVTAVKNQPGASCTVSGEFNNGYVIQFAGNAQSFTNINVDFRQDTFEKGKLYDVKLAVPGVSEAVIPSKAFEKNLLVTDLRPNKKLSAALIDASVLDFEIEGNVFRFYMTGLKAALKDYRQCAGEAIPAEAPKVMAKTQEPEEENAAVTPLPKDLKADQDTLAALEDKPAKKRSDAPKDARMSEKLAAELKEKPKPDEPSLRDKMAELAAMEEEDQAEKLLKSPPSKNIDKPDETLFDRKKEPREEKPPVKLAEKPAAPKPEAAPKQVETKTPPKREIIRSPEPTITKSPPVRMEADFTKLPEKPLAAPTKREMPPLKEAGEIPPPSVQPVDTEMRNKVRDLEKEIFRLREENESLSADLKDSLDSAREERLSVSSDNWNLERATMRFNEAERQIERLGRQLQAQKAQCASDTRELEGMLFDPKLTNQQQLAKLAALEADLEKARADLLMQQRTYEERIKLLEQRLDGR